MRRLVFSAIAVLTLVAPAQTAAQTGSQTMSAEMRAVLTLDSLWARTYATHDTISAVRLMADEFYMTSASGVVKDKAAEMHDIRPHAGLRMNYFRTEQPTVRVYGATAVVSGLASWSYEMNGRTAGNRRRYTAIYIKGGPLGWRLTELHMALVPNS